MVIICHAGPPRDPLASFRQFADEYLDTSNWQELYKDRQGETWGRGGGFPREDGTLAKPPDVQKFLLEQSEQQVFDSPQKRFSGANTWKPSLFGLTLEKVLQLGKEASPWSAVAQILPTKSLRDQFKPRYVTSSRWESIFEGSTALILGGGLGSPHHLDYIDWDLLHEDATEERMSEDDPAWPDIEMTTTDAWGVNIGQRKWFHTVDRFQNGADRLHNWAHDLAIYDTAEQQLTCALGKARIQQGPFQGIYSLGWPTVGQFIALEKAYGVPAHLHAVECGDAYLLRRGTPHLVINSGFACSVAGDNVYHSACGAGPQQSWVDRSWRHITRGLYYSLRGG